MQQRSRRSTITTESAVHGGIPGSATTSLKMRRKVRRRRKSSVDMEEVQSLVLVALLSVCCTAALVWMAAKLYSAIFVGGGKHNSHGPDFGHRHHHVHGDPNQQNAQVDDDYDVLPWNPIYRVPEAMETVGDRSNEYATLRKQMDEIMPPDVTRSLARVQDLTQDYPPLTTYDMNHLASSHSDVVDSNFEPYDIHNCPETPPPGYPFEWKLAAEVLGNWPVTEVDNIPTKIHQGLCVFDYTHDYEKALAYRKAEKPFVVVNDPDVARTVERWNIPGYLSNMLGKDVRHRAEYNTNSHFLYHAPKDNRHRNRHRPNHRRHQDEESQEQANGEIMDAQGRVARLQREDVIPEDIRMTYDEWLEKANKTHVGTEEEHWYFRLIGCGYMDATGGCDMGSSEMLYDELPYFQPRKDGRNAIYLGDPREQKGIHCRFGMKGVIAENHFDGTRNAIVVLGGRRRYILSHPKQCENLALLPREHESGRHSEVDYANPDLERYPEFGDALANEVILEAGQVLYLPTYWFHYIVSLDLNYQCNTRSGVSKENQPFIRDCGF